MLWFLACEATGPRPTGDSALLGDSGSDSTPSLETGDTGQTETDPPGADGILTVCEDGTAEFLDFPEAAEEAAEGDRVMICPGTYTASPAYGWNKVFSVVGAGMGVTTLTAQDVASAMLYFNTSSEAADGRRILIEGLSLDGESEPTVQIYVGHGGDWSFDIRDVELSDSNDTRDQTSVLQIFTDGDVAVDGLYAHDNAGTWKGEGTRPLIGLTAATATLRHALITDNVVTDNHLVKLEAHVSVIENSTFLRNEVANDVMLGGYSVAYAAAGDDGESGVWNSVFVANVADGMIALGPRVEGTVFVDNASDYAILTAYDSEEHYNLFWGNNHTVYRRVGDERVGDTDLELDPLFTNPAADDYTLQPGSPAMDAGNPDAAYNDVDGTRNDMGAYGGPNGSW